MIYFKACPRCQGDMSLDSDQYGWYMECLQCGYEAHVQNHPSKAKPAPTAAEGEKVEAA